MLPVLMGLGSLYEHYGDLAACSHTILWKGKDRLYLDPKQRAYSREGRTWYSACFRGNRIK